MCMIIRRIFKNYFILIKTIITYTIIILPFYKIIKNSIHFNNYMGKQFQKLVDI